MVIIRKEPELLGVERVKEEKGVLSIMQVYYLSLLSYKLSILCIGLFKMF